MIGTIRKHQKWLWAVIIAATVGGLIFWTGQVNNRGGGSSGRNASYGMLAGNNVTADQFANAQKEVMLDQLFRTGKWPNPQSVETARDTYFRLLMIQKEKDMDVHISTDAAAYYARIRLANLSQALEKPIGTLDEFTEEILKPQNMSSMDFDRYLRHQIGIEQMARVFGLSGQLVTPQEAEDMYRAENKEIQTSLVYFSASNFMSRVNVSPDVIAKFFTNQLANYRIPDQVQVAYVKFSISNYIAAAKTTLTNLAQFVQANVEHLGTNLYPGTKTPEESRAAIQRAVLQDYAAKAARRAAGDFAEQLDSVQPRSLNGFYKFASSNSMPVISTTPFGLDEGPQGLEDSPGFARKAFELTTEDPFGGPVQGENAIYVLALKNRIPSRMPEFSEIAARVESDYRYLQAEQMAGQSAIAFATTASNGIAAGKSFAAICSQASVSAVSLPPFSLNVRSVPKPFENKIELGTLRQVAFSTPVGKSSQPASAQGGAFVLYVEKELPMDESKVREQTPNFLAYLRQARENDAFNLWFSAQLRQDPEFLQTIEHLINENEMKSAGRAPKS